MHFDAEAVCKQRREHLTKHACYKRQQDGFEWSEIRQRLVKNSLKQFREEMRLSRIVSTKLGTVIKIPA